MEQKLVVPDSIEPYIGYKCLGVVGSGTSLQSLIRPINWPKKERFEAQCLADPERLARINIPHVLAPNSGCDCGIYVGSTNRAAAYYRERRVLVEVALWGNVVVATDGARGQYAYPQKIIAYCTDRAFVEDISRLYEIPIEGGYVSSSYGIKTSPEIRGLHNDWIERNKTS